MYAANPRPKNRDPHMTVQPRKMSSNPKLMRKADQRGGTRKGSR